jgi:dihydropyrimidinase
MTAKDLDRPGLEGSKWMCSPPPRDVSDQQALWRALALGDLQQVSSDHAPFPFDDTGKLKAGPGASFKQIANGQPGLETRLPLLFDAMVSKDGPGLSKFVSITATEPAKTYNLHPKKGTITIGADADIVLWNPKTKVTLKDAMMHSKAGYTPFAGRTVTGWPETVLRRGAVIVSDSRLSANAGSGRYLPRSGGEAAKPAGILAPEMDPRRNFGAKLF